MEQINFRRVDFFRKENAMACVRRRLGERDGAEVGRKLRKMTREFLREFPDATEEFERIVRRAEVRRGR